MDSQKKKITIIVSSIIASLLLIVAFALFWTFSKKQEEPFNFQEAFNNINVKSMIVNELDKQLSSKLDDYKLTLEEKDDKTETLAGEDFSLKYYLNDEAKNLDNINDPLLWIFSILNPKDSEESGAGISFNEDLLRNSISNLSCFQNVIEPKNPSIEYKDGSYVVIDGVIGNKVDSDLLYTSVVNAITQGETKINLESLGCYITPKYKADSQEVVNAVDELNKYSKESITYNIGSNQEYLNSETIKSWLKVDDDFNVTFNTDNVYGFVNSLASKYNTVGKTRNFPSSSGGTVQVSGGVYGWKVNVDGEVESLISAIKNGTTTKELTFSQKGAALGDNDIGNSYVEIDLGRQHLWLYIDGALIMDTNVISGNVSKNYTTPAGVYSLYYKQKDQILRGEDYATPVSFWMPFNGGIGLHDASWRTAEELANPQTYLTAGSHGCVNMTYEAAQTIYNNVWAGIPIVCYY